MVQNTTHDEANGVTYSVTASRILSDGELFRAIRGAILQTGLRPKRGETLHIDLKDLGEARTLPTPP